MVKKEAESPEIIKRRWDLKKEQIEILANNIQKLRYNVTLGLKDSDNEKVFLTALVVAIILETSERVGNEASASNDRVGITGLKKRQVSIDGNKVTLEYTGKSGVEHVKSFSDEKIAKALKIAIKRSKTDDVFCTSDGFKIKADRINRYLSDFQIRSKDIRGHSANKWMLEKLKNGEIEDNENKRKKFFMQSLRKTAIKVGHGASTLRKHYLIPELETNYIKNGTIINLNERESYEEGGEIKIELLAPNGKKSNLTPEQYKLVRTPEFKKWFGDWENDPENSSKVVDDNGEPLVVYHGTNESFNEFSNKFNKRMSGFYFSNNIENSKTYGNKILSVFINIKNPLIIDSKGKKFTEDLTVKVLAKYPQEQPYETELEIDLDEVVYMTKIGKRENSFIEIKNNENYDGNIFKNLIDPSLSSLYSYENKNQDTIVAFEPSQIKLADGTNVTFDSENPDIRFEKGGVLSNIEFKCNYEKYFEYVPLSEIEKYIEFDREVEHKISKKYLDELTEQIKVNGITYPITLEVYDNKGLIVEGNHRIAVAKRLGIKYIPVRVVERSRPIKGTIYETKFKELPSKRNSGYAKVMYGIRPLDLDNSAAVFGFTKVEPKFENGGEIINSDNFKKWFNGSKVIDEFGKPKIVYHGTNRKFNVFDSKEIGQGTGNFGHYGYGFYFSDDIREAKGYGDIILECYLNIKKPFTGTDEEFDLLKEAGFSGIEDKIPLTIDFKDLHQKIKLIDSDAYEFMSIAKEKGIDNVWSIYLEAHPHPHNNKIDLNDIYDMLGYTDLFNQNNSVPDYIIDELNSFGIKPKLNYGYPYSQSLHWVTDLGNNSQDFTDFIKSLGYDGVIYGSEYVAFHPNQIKLADGTNRNFDSENPDIRFEQGGEIEKITFDNFHKGTKADFKEIMKAGVPKRKPDFVSDSGSKYWFTANSIIRQSDHWGQLDTCNWTLDGENGYKTTQGICKISDFSK